jgi:hypothetical protein
MVPARTPAPPDSRGLLAQTRSCNYRIPVEGRRRRLGLPPTGAAAQFNEHYPSASLGIVLLWVDPSGFDTLQGAWMSQQVDIEFDDGTTARLATAALGPGTLYGVRWQGDWVTEELDTNVATQCGAADLAADENCDFTHARRALGAAGSAAHLVIAELPPESVPFQRATVHLHTNQRRERGRVSILRADRNSLSIEVLIGTCQDKTANAHPQALFRYGPYEVSKPKSNSRMELVFRVLAAERERILDALRPHKLPGTAQP